ncbi:hypothetical protein ACFOLL_12495 [Falsochrobactrum ovis]|uniref:Uncharacterized protein n=1 Tax=Falsochrobactrum ovis TaxID=1293442 RepID=A0A364JT24_9HYPH|nr:hypothetical protein [Falsochrobactrum ovis]RAK26400.1 hypothetical protein C7374_11486 [Falsochrobactrum ovis]
MRRIIQWLIGRAANLTPNVVYYPKKFRLGLNSELVDLASKRGNGATPMSIAAVSLCCALDDNLKVGDKATFELAGVMHGAHEVGDFIVTVRRAA